MTASVSSSLTIVNGDLESRRPLTPGKDNAFVPFLDLISPNHCLTESY